MTGGPRLSSLRSFAGAVIPAAWAVTFTRTLIYVILIAIAIVEAFPLLWMIVTSVKDSHEVFNTLLPARDQLAELPARLVRDELSRPSRQLALCHEPDGRAGRRPGDPGGLRFRALQVSGTRAGLLRFHRRDDDPAAGDPHSDVSVPEVAASAQFADRAGAVLRRRRRRFRHFPDADVLPQPAWRTRRLGAHRRLQRLPGLLAHLPAAGPARYGQRGDHSIAVYVE